MCSKNQRSSRTKRGIQKQEQSSKTTTDSSNTNTYHTTYSHTAMNRIITYLLLLLAVYVVVATASECRRVGYDHLVHREGCAPRTVRLNACLGGCPSFTIPLSGRLRAFFPNKLFISRSRCCSIKSTHDVTVTLICKGGDKRDVILKSANECHCSSCRFAAPPTKPPEQYQP